MISSLVVSALYEMSSKASIDFYIRSFRHMWKTIPSDMLVFTSEKFAHRIMCLPKHASAKRTIVNLEIDDWKSWSILESNRNAVDHISEQAKIFGTAIKKNVSKDLGAIPATPPTVPSVSSEPSSLASSSAS